MGRTTGFWSGRSGFESLSCQIFLWFHWHLSEFLIVPMAQWVGQQGSEAVEAGSIPSLYLHFLTLLIRPKIVIPTSYAWEVSRPEFVWNQEEFPDEIGKFRNQEDFRTVRKKIDKIVIPYYPKNIRCQNISETPYEIFRYRETKNFRRKIVILPSPLINNFSIPVNFLKHRRVPLQSFSVLWDKKISTKSWYPII